MQYVQAGSSFSTRHGSFVIVQTVPRLPSSHTAIEVRCSREGGVPTISYEVHAKLGLDGKPTGFYRKAQCSSALGSLPLIFCDHLHPDIESARACRYFDSIPADGSGHHSAWSTY